MNQLAQGRKMTEIRRWRAPLQKGSGMGSATSLLNARPADLQHIVLLCWSSVITVVGRFRIRLGKKPSSDIFAVVLAGITLLLNGCGDDGIMSRFMDTSRHLITIPSRVLPCSVACLADQGPAVPRLALTFRGNSMRSHGPPRTYLIMTLVGIVLTACKPDAKVE